jgi:hypothetical protein
MKKTYLLGGGIAVLTAAILAGCNSNDDAPAVAAPAVAAPATQSLTVTPSLGKILNAKVVARNATTGAEIGKGNTGNTGIATFNVTKTADPVVVEVQGDTGVKYFDESKMAEVNFSAGQTIRAVTSSLTANIGVSALTDVAYKTALKNTGGSDAIPAISADVASKANEAIRKSLAPELESITIAPTLVGSAADLANIQSGDGGEYALKLAALAKLSAGSATPALDILAKLQSDFADGNFDGKAGNVAVGAYTSTNLAAEIQKYLNAIITANSGLAGRFNTALFAPTFGSITINVNTGGNTTIPTGNYNLAITTTVSGFSSPVVNIPNIPKPTTKTEFCAAEDVTDVFDVAGSSFTINSCSFSGNIGDITATVNVQGFNTTYNAHYVYTAM